jgi:hypothetical protein
MPDMLYLFDLAKNIIYSYLLGDGDRNPYSLSALLSLGGM